MSHITDPNKQFIADDLKASVITHQCDWSSCSKCPISRRIHNKVFFRGTLPCDVLFIGEAPGKTEDLMGMPFVGQAGRKVLDVWIKECIEDSIIWNSVIISWAITNIVACRPCKEMGGRNETPSIDEITNCSDRLTEFVEIAKPKVIVALGRTAELNLPHSAFKTLPTLALKHPAFILRGLIGSAVDRAEQTKLLDFLRKEFAK